MDSVIFEKMQQLRFVSKKNGSFRLGATILKDGDEPIIVLSELSTAHDNVTANFEEIATFIFNRVLAGHKQEDPCWIQHYPGDNGFGDTFEVVDLNWNRFKNAYEFNQRQTLKGETLDYFLNLLEAKQPATA